MPRNNSKANIKRGLDIKEMRALRVRFEHLFWNITESHGTPATKDYLVIIMYQNMDIIRLLERLKSGDRIIDMKDVSKNEKRI